jgi:hypothetical protein
MDTHTDRNGSASRGVGVARRRKDVPAGGDRHGCVIGARETGDEAADRLVTDERVDDPVAPTRPIREAVMVEPVPARW